MITVMILLVVGAMVAQAIHVNNKMEMGKETYEICKKIYDTTPVGSKLSYDYVSEWTETIETQLLRAGLRLARVLNEIFK